MELKLYEDLLHAVRTHPHMENSWKERVITELREEYYKNRGK